MKSKFPSLICAQCGSNRLKFPKSAADAVKCDDCGHTVASLAELQAKIVNGDDSGETRAQRRGRHAREVAESHEQMRASVAATDRLIVASHEMMKRHRKQDEAADD